MRALILEHNNAELPGLVAERAEQHGIEPVPLVVSDAVTYPDPGEFDFIIPLGAPESVRDAHIPWIPRELAMLREAIQQHVPVLGICFGAQMLAHALGGEVRSGEEPEIGWRRIEPIDPTLVTSDRWFELHFDVFTLPPGATEVARNDAGVQGFALGPHVGVQFHPEITPEILELWLDRWPALFERLQVSRDEILAETVDRHPAARDASYRLFDAWLARAKESGAHD